MGSVLVFFVLAALYENWSLPLAVILVVPMCLLSGAGRIWLANMDINIFVQVGFVVLVGLASKNAILIVDSPAPPARSASRSDAAVEAARVRLRPILMTSFAFILVSPAVISHAPAPKCAALSAPPSSPHDRRHVLESSSRPCSTM